MKTTNKIISIVLRKYGFSYAVFDSEKKFFIHSDRVEICDMKNFCNSKRNKEKIKNIKRRKNIIGTIENRIDFLIFKFNAFPVFEVLKNEKLEQMKVNSKLRKIHFHLLKKYIVSCGASFTRNRVEICFLENINIANFNEEIYKKSSKIAELLMIDFEKTLKW